VISTKLRVGTPHVDIPRSDVSYSPLQCMCRYGRKTVSLSRLKCPSLQSDFDQSSSVYTASRQSAKSDVSVSPLQGLKRTSAVSGHRSGHCR
jgi:hypothetical protein